MYRYTAKKHTQSLLAMGILRIGTLHDFRRSEHRKGITDPQEGRKEVFHPIDYLHISDSNQTEANEVQQFGFSLKNTTDVTFKDLTLARAFNEPDCYILCTSKAYSQGTMSEFEGADSCYEIHNPEYFYRVLTEAINAQVPVKFQGVHEVIYQERIEQWNGKDWGHHPALIKEPIFSKQAELRAIWQPLHTQNIEPLMICDYNLIGACRELPI